MSNSSNNNKREKLEPGSSNIIERLLLRTPKQLKLYCKLLDNEKRQDLYQKVLKEMRRSESVEEAGRNSCCYRRGH